MWFVYAAAAMCCFAGMQLLMKQLTRMGLVAPVILLFLFAVSTALYAAHVAVVRPPMGLSARAVLLLTGAGILSYVGNLYMVRALTHAPNPGYAMAVIGLQALPVALAAVLLFGSEFSWIKAAGVVLSIAGVALLLVDG